MNILDSIWDFSGAELNVASWSLGFLQAGKRMEATDGHHIFAKANQILDAQLLCVDV